MRTATLGSCLLALTFALTGTALALEAAESTLVAEKPLANRGSLRIENLLGSVLVQANPDSGTVRVEARVIAEAKTKEQAQELADSIRLQHGIEEGELRFKVLYPLDRFSTLRQPKAGVKGVLSRWTKPMIRKGADVEYGGQTVQVGSGRKATGLAVHLIVSVPLDATLSVSQSVGDIHLRSVRGRLSVETVNASVLAQSIFGSLSVETQRGQVQVQSFQGQDLDVRTESGSLELLDIRANDASLRTGSGAIRGSKIAVGALSIESGSGPVEFTGVEPSTVNVNSSSGKVDLSTTFERMTGGVIYSETGDVTLRVGKLAHFDLLAETKSGAVKTLGLDLDIIGQNGQLSKLRHGKGGVDLEVRARGGTITVRPYSGSRLDILVGDAGT